MTEYTDIQSFKLYAEQGGENRQQQLTDTVIEPDKLEIIADLRSDNLVVQNMPPMADVVELQLARETARVSKRNVLPDYVSDTETYKTEVLETTATRFLTHEPCVEHIPVRHEKAVDRQEKLQNLFSDDVQYRNSEGNQRFTPDLVPKPDRS